MGIECGVFVLLGVGGYLICRLIWRTPSTPPLPPLAWSAVTNKPSKCISDILTERGFNSCINAYSIKHGCLPTEVFANYETISSMTNFRCSSDAGLVLATGDVVAIKLSAHSDTNDLTFKGNANDTDK